VDEIVTLSVQRERYAAVLARDLERVVEQLGSIPSVQKVILFGSYAAGRRDLFTDLDILVVMDSPLSFIPRNVELARHVRAGVALDLLAYTPRELERMRDRPFLRHVLKTGKVLYEKRSSQ